MLTTLPSASRASTIGRDMRAPYVQRGALLIRPIVPLVEANDASTAPRNVVEDSLGHFEAHFEFLQSCSDRAAKIMKPPALDAACFVEIGLRLRKAVEDPGTALKNEHRRVGARLAGSPSPVATAARYGRRRSLPARLGSSISRGRVRLRPTSSRRPPRGVGQSGSEVSRCRHRHLVLQWRAKRRATRRPTSTRSREATAPRLTPANGFSASRSLPIAHPYAARP